MAALGKPKRQNPLDTIKKSHKQAMQKASHPEWITEKILG